MIYLILKIFVYLLLALAAGFGAGWLTRNLQSAKKEEALQRTLTDSRAKLPQYESLLRSRDQQLKSLRDEVKEKDGRFAEMRVEIADLEKALKSKDRELRKYQVNSGDGEQGDGLELNEVDVMGQPADARADARVAELEAECGQLRAELDALQNRAAGPGAGSDAGGRSAMEDVLRSEVEELEARLRQTAAEQERLTKALQQEQRKTVELERERDLQNRSLQVLHQQLEVERERGQQAASG